MTDYRDAFRARAEADGYEAAIWHLRLTAALARGLVPPEGPDPEGRRWPLERLAWALDLAADRLETARGRA